MENDKYWSPHYAMGAYLQTLQLLQYKREPDNGGDPNRTHGNNNLMEPTSAEFISALAAGTKSRLLLHVISSAGDRDAPPLTAALAAAAKQTGGRLVCVLPQNDAVISEYSSHLRRRRCGDLNLSDSVELVAPAGNPRDAVARYKEVDFAVFDAPSDGEDQARLLRSMDLNRRGCVVVATNALSRAGGGCLGDVVGGESVILPIGGGLELTRIGFGRKRERRRFKRFHVTFED